MSVMKKLNNHGDSNALLISLILVSVLLVGSLAFGVWAFLSRQDYKTNVDAKIAAASEVVKQQTMQEDAANFAEQEKQPLKDYKGPASYGSIVIKYPKTWSAYVEESQNQAIPLNGYFNPAFVPKKDDSNSTFALRMQVVSQGFDQVVNGYDSNVTQGKTKAKAFKLDKVAGSSGLMLTGQLDGTKQGTMVLLKLRDKTLKLWTEGDQYKSDFTKLILPNVVFEP